MAFAGLALVGSVAVGLALARLARALVHYSVDYAPVMLGAVAITASVLCTPQAPPAASLVLGWALLLLTAADMAAYRLPDAVTLPLCAAGVAFTAIGGGPLYDHLVGAILGFSALLGVDLAYQRLRGRSGLGLGDAKLFAATGAWLGWATLPSVLLLACGGSLVWVGVRQIRLGRRALALPLPFGPALAGATWLVWLLQWRD
ncbi:A24 family peptidase [Caulobacter sp. S45]|uniref:prepilin peptidase n=1 Tax=Caulobacter sp. S45 TaxID=1641861 RepID=UPI0015755FFF|nr:A24 family peptidase [Caulobacter sp. S45]